MIIQTGLRTDIPAFYSRWFANRLKAGFVCVRNPYSISAVTRYRLSPDVVDVIGFCTKNPAPMLPYMDLLRPYGQFWFVTITPYGTDIEPQVPPKEQVVESFRRLSSLVGPDCIGWRYDPILLSEQYSMARHLADFEQLADALCGYTKICVISFIDLYAKVKRNFPEVREVNHTEQATLAQAFVSIGKRHGMTIKACGEGKWLADYGVDCEGCMTLATYEKAIGCRLDAPAQRSSRSACACLLNCDIGAYDSCGHLCRYCYANANANAVQRNMRLHDPNSPFLIGGSLPGDCIRDAVQESWKDGQLTMFDP